MKIINRINILILLTLIFLIFKKWISPEILSSGDGPFYFWENIRGINILPSIWRTDGIGYFTSQLYPYFYLHSLIKLLWLLNFPWFLIERILWYFPFLILSFTSSFLLEKTLFPNGKFLIFSSLIFIFNTYSLMIIGGGQVSIALSYSLVPLVLLFFIKYLKIFSFKIALLCGLVTSLQFSFEPRIGLITVVICFLYYLFTRGFSLKSMKIFLVVFLVAFGIHMYWILPSIFIYLQNQKISLYLPSVVVADWLPFLSIAQFSKTLSLLHPNWPENIFGKTSFMQPEFLLLPILAFSSLLFLNKKSKKNSIKEHYNHLTIYFFVLLGLLGAFLAKGINPPFGEVYRFLFDNIPGFNMFRDPTKFYFLIALSYSILIPFSVNNIYLCLYKYCNNKKLVISKLGNLFNLIPSLFVLLFTIYLLFLIKPAWTGKLGGTFKTKAVPNDYLKVKDFIYNQKGFFRTIWLPATNRFGYFDNNHPSINAYYYFNVSDPVKLVNVLKEKNKEEELRNISVKYVIIPPDPEGEYFSKDWKFDKKAKERFENEIDKITYLKNKKKIGDIIIYEIEKPYNHFSIEGKNKIEYKYENPTKYLLSGKSSGKTKITFSEKFDSLWELKINNKIVKSEKNNFDQNIFSINIDGKWSGVVEFLPQKYVYYGLIVSALTIIFSFILLILPKKV